MFFWQKGLAQLAHSLSVMHGQVCFCIMMGLVNVKMDGGGLGFEDGRWILPILLSWSKYVESCQVQE